MREVRASFRKAEQPQTGRSGGTARNHKRHGARRGAQEISNVVKKSILGKTGGAIAAVKTRAVHPVRLAAARMTVDNYEIRWTSASESVLVREAVPERLVLDSRDWHSRQFGRSRCQIRNLKQLLNRSNRRVTSRISRDRTLRSSLSATPGPEPKWNLCRSTSQRKFPHPRISTWSL